jgi:hypothetical protein
MSDGASLAATKMPASNGFSGGREALPNLGRPRLETLRRSACAKLRAIAPIKRRL